MSNLLSSGVAWLAGQLEANASVLIGYSSPSRAAQSVTGGIPATLGHTDFEQISKDGSIESFQSRDYLFTASRLVLGGIVVLPARGDVITETDANNNTFRYQVMAPGNEPHYRFSDPFRVRLRVHTKQVG